MSQEPINLRDVVDWPSQHRRQAGVHDSPRSAAHLQPGWSISSLLHERQCFPRLDTPAEGTLEEAGAGNPTLA